MSAPDIFLSYNREDQETAQRFAEAFESEGYSVWWDVSLRSGEAYDQVTEEALRTAKAVVVLWSQKSVVSRWVRAEATLADRNRTLVPARIEACDLPIMFELTQTADLSHWTGDVSDPAWCAFLADVRRMAGRVDSEADVAMPASSHSANTFDGVPMVAMLPITHRDGGELEVLAEDLTEDITRELAQTSHFRVMAAGTMAAWRGKAIDYRVLGRELGVACLVEGKLQRSGEDIRLTLQLIDPAQGGTLRSLRMTRKLADLTAAPEALPVAVAAELGDQIFQVEINRAAAKTGPLTAWDHYVRGISKGSRWTSDSPEAVIAEARSAVAAAPDFSYARAGLAAVLATADYSGDREIDAISRREINQHINRAMQLDGENPEILSNVAHTYTMLGEGEASLRLAQRAVALAPNSPSARFALGRAFFAMGRSADAIAALNSFERLVPNDRRQIAALTTIGICLLFENRPAEAEAAFDHSLALHPNFGSALWWKVVAEAQQGKEEEAKATIIRLRQSESGVGIDQPIAVVGRSPALREFATEAEAIFRRLWDETGGSA